MPGTMFGGGGQAIDKMKRQSHNFYGLHNLSMKTDNRHKKN